MRSTASAGPDTTVDRGPFDRGDSTRRLRCHNGVDIVGRHVDGAHRTAGRQLPHQLAAADDESCRIVERQYLGQNGRGELAHAVADEEPRFDTEFEQRRAERVRHGEQRRLGVTGVIDGVAVGEHQVEQPVGCCKG